MKAVLYYQMYFLFHEAVKASAISNVLVAALCQKKWEVVGK